MVISSSARTACCGLSYNMSGKTLIFLTKQYPYYSDEPYVTAELQQLCKVFDKVYIYPSDHYETNSKQIFEVPEGAEVIKLSLNIPGDFRKFTMLFQFVRAYFYEFTKTHNRIWFLKNTSFFFKAFITQYAQGVGLERFVKRKGITDSVVYYSYWLGTQALCLSTMKSRNAIKHFYCRAHALDLYHEDWNLQGKGIRIPAFLHYKLKWVDAIFPVSNHGKNNLLSKRADANVVVHYLGVHEKGMNPEEKNETFTIVTCSSVDINKRVHLLGKALSKIDRPVHWVHFGRGALQQQLFDSIQSDQVKLDFRGWTPNNEVRAFYNSHHVDLFVNLSLVEGLPVSIMEVLSHGIPVLATSVYGTPEAVVEGLSGKLIAGNFTDKELEEALIWLMDHPLELSQMRKGARSVFEEKFQAQKNHTQFAKYLSSLP